MASSLESVTDGEFELGMFDFARLGVILAVAGAILVLVLRPRILPQRASLGLATRKGVAVEYMTESVVREGIEAVERNRAIQVSGRLYRWLDPLVQSVWLRPLFKALAPGR